MVSLDNRLALIAEFVRRDKIICDVGTDHALLPCYLVQTGATRVIASDINDGPLESARETMLLHKISGITLLKSDGLDNIPFAEDVIIAGMGGELISRILSRCKFLHKDLHLILQPMTKAEILRKELYKQGFEIAFEKTTCESGKHYVVISANYTGKTENIDKVFAVCGKIKDKAFLQKQADIIRCIGENIHASRPEKSRENLMLAEKIQQHIAEITD